jgi:poly-beta-1,6-N-acetyl-D-glucosamine synthase
MDPMPTRYVIITPVRDEEAHLPFTIESVVHQTIRPAQWIIVDDGSTDNTANIIDEAARQHSWICPVRRPNRGFRKSGGGVVDAFNEGYRALTCSDWDFMVKLDGDLSFEPSYFGASFGYFHRERKLGVGGGVICYVENGQKTIEQCPAFHVRGATKIYRRACWDAIGGFWPAPGWDTMDEVKAHMLGWTTHSFDDLHLVHYRATGTAEGIWNGLTKNGRANYISGYHPLFMLAKSVAHVIRRPYVVGSVALLYGYVTAYLSRVPRVDDPELIRYLQRQQLAKLAGRETIWR